MLKLYRDANRKLVKWPLHIVDMIWWFVHYVYSGLIATKIVEISNQSSILVAEKLLLQAMHHSRSSSPGTSEVNPVHISSSSCPQELWPIITVAAQSMQSITNWRWIDFFRANLLPSATAHHIIYPLELDEFQWNRCSRFLRHPGWFFTATAAVYGPKGPVGKAENPPLTISHGTNVTHSETVLSPSAISSLFLASNFVSV